MELDARQILMENSFQTTNNILTLDSVVYL